ncbi:transcription elongation factor SPT5 [Humulus lupulus]|uniref:transcription elongation factor SPT5 n=1 Tax=Humulus lupulus TaxID=3486 RepID=UPI002B40D6DA|nr:transcription elongation factor SPT5 [Humulus lupulus]
MIMMNFWAAHISTMFSSPLVSSIVTLSALIFLYVPYQFLRIVFSPVLILTGVLLLALLRLGAVQKFEDEHKREEIKLHFQPQREEGETATTATDDIKDNKESDSSDDPGQFAGSQDEDFNWVDYKSETDSETDFGFDPNPGFEVSFVQWNLRAPLEVIYEEYEGEEEDDDEDEDEDADADENEEKENRILGIEKQHTFPRYYHPDSDSDDSSDGDYPEAGFWESPPVNKCFRWEDEDRDGLIEIALGDDDIGKRHRGLDFHVVEEDNLIEIDIYRTRSNDELQARNDDVPPPFQASHFQLTSN